MSLTDKERVVERQFSVFWGDCTVTEVGLYLTLLATKESLHLKGSPPFTERGSNNSRLGVQPLTGKKNKTIKFNKRVSGHET